jgi:hypothetical protein
MTADDSGERVGSSAQATRLHLPHHGARSVGYTSRMDDWRNRLEDSILRSTTPAVAAKGPDAATMLTIAFGRVRSELTYALELGRAHSLPVAGNVAGDDAWVRFGNITLRFVFSARAAVIVLSVVHRDDVQITWNAEKSSIVGPDGEPLDVEAWVREAIDATVAAWRASQAQQPTITEQRAPLRPPLPTMPDDDRSR